MELSAVWTHNDAEVSLAHAVAIFADGRRYEESGDSSPQNAKNIGLHWRRMALRAPKHGHSGMPWAWTSVVSRKWSNGYALKAGQLTYDCRYSTIHGMPVTGGRGFRGLKPLWYNGVPP